MRLPLLLIASALLLPSPASSQGAIATRGEEHARPATASRAARVRTPVRIDGRLDDPAWTDAPVTSDFTQIDPEEGKPASQKTEVRVLFDDDFLYVGVRLHDSGRITGPSAGVTCPSAIPTGLG